MLPKEEKNYEQTQNQRDLEEIGVRLELLDWQINKEKGKHIWKQSVPSKNYKGWCFVNSNPTFFTISTWLQGAKNLQISTLKK